MYAIHKLTNHLDGRKWQEEKRKEFISLVCLKQEEIKIDKVESCNFCGGQQFTISPISTEWGKGKNYYDKFDFYIIK